MTRLIDLAHDGIALHAEVIARLNSVNMSLSDLTKKANIHRSTLHRWAKGTSPSVPTVLAIEAVLPS